MTGLLAFLRAHHVAHLATAGEGGPHAAPVFYAILEDPLRLAWTSSPRVLHSRHLAAAPELALSIAPSAPGLRGIAGVQMRGTAVEDAAGREAWLARFPDAEPYLRAVADARFYLFTPSWIRLVEGPTRRRELTP